MVSWRIILKGCIILMILLLKGSFGDNELNQREFYACEHISVVSHLEAKTQDLMGRLAELQQNSDWADYYVQEIVEGIKALRSTLTDTLKGINKAHDNSKWANTLSIDGFLQNELENAKNSLENVENQLSTADTIVKILDKGIQERKDKGEASSSKTKEYNARELAAYSCIRAGDDVEPNMKKLKDILKKLQQSPWTANVVEFHVEEMSELIESLKETLSTILRGINKANDANEWSQTIDYNLQQTLISLKDKVEEKEKELLIIENTVETVKKDIKERKEKADEEGESSSKGEGK